MTVKDIRSRRVLASRKPAPHRDEKALLEAAQEMLEAFEQRLYKTDAELKAFCRLADAVARERANPARRRLMAEPKAKGGAR